MPEKSKLKDLLTPAPQPAAIRAATWDERVGDVVRDLYEAAAAQPIGRLADLIGLSDFQGIVDSYTTPGMRQSRGEMPAPGKGIKAYHGSPHDFDQFKLDKIGTGEGAQAYGHGLYFADQEATAKTYRDTLSRYKAEIDGKPIVEMFHDGTLAPTIAAKTGLSRPESISAANAMSIAVREGKPVSQVISDKIASAKSNGGSFDDGMWERIRDRMAVIEPPVHSGRMYEVNIKADPDQFLDWDAPLSQQSAVKEKTADVYAAALERKARMNPHLSRTQVEYTMTGRDLVGPADGAMEFRGGSHTLKERGIPGIKYLDGGSRAAGEGSRNYVVFDDSLIEILRKYGLLMPAAGGSLSSLVYPTQAEQ